LIAECDEEAFQLSSLVGIGVIRMSVRKIILKVMVNIKLFLGFSGDLD